MKKAVLLLFLSFFANMEVGRAQDFDYLQKARESLEKGECEKAQKFYNVYKEVEHKTDVDIEGRIVRCIDDKEKSSVKVGSAKPEKVYDYKVNIPLYPLYAKDFTISQKGMVLSDSEVRSLFANSESYELYDEGMRMGKNASVPTKIFCVTGGIIMGVGVVYHWYQISQANKVGDMINSLDHGESFIDLDGYYYYPYANTNNGAKRESLQEAQAQFETKSRNGLYIVAGGLTSIAVGVIWGSSMKSIGRAKIRKAVDLYNGKGLYTQSDVELKYGLTGNGVRFVLLF